MEKYREAKGLLFSQLGNRYEPEPDKGTYAVLNVDDKATPYYARITPAQVVTYGINKPADVRAENIHITAAGTEFTLKTFCGETEIKMKLIGKFNVYNALAAISVALIEGIPLESIKESLAQIPGVNGRFEPVSLGQPYTVLVDYAHTPDSLENVLTTIREFAVGNVICVVGCGGDRDRTKRPLMAEIAVKLSDLAVFTSDNPRSEDPEAILADMLEGAVSYDTERYTTIPDRRQAIRFAIEQAKAGDVVLIAGKGHETYQEIKGVRYDFDDREVAREAIAVREQSEGKL
jgi:UDP-N-acetylmuramoyl-L-alanyl-D-glutamate--2,6-diaminopimelate ligase